MSEFGSYHARGAGIYIDGWGAGPFLIEVEVQTFRFGDSDRFGPFKADKHGDPCRTDFGARSSFWKAHRCWVRQGRRMQPDGIACVWDKPKPTTVRHMGGRHFMVVEQGDDDGETHVRTYSQPPQEPPHE